MALPSGRVALAAVMLLLLPACATEPQEPRGTAREAATAAPSPSSDDSDVGADVDDGDGGTVRGPTPGTTPEPTVAATPAVPAQPEPSSDLGALAAAVGCADVTQWPSPPAYAERAVTCVLDGAPVHLYAIPDDDAYVAFLRSTSSYPSAPPPHLRVQGVVVIPTEPAQYDLIAGALG